MDSKKLTSKIARLEKIMDLFSEPWNHYAQRSMDPVVSIQFTMNGSPKNIVEATFAADNIIEANLGWGGFETLPLAAMFYPFKGNTELGVRRLGELYDVMTSEDIIVGCYEAHIPVFNLFRHALKGDYSAKNINSLDLNKLAKNFQEADKLMTEKYGWPGTTTAIYPMVTMAANSDSISKTIKQMNKAIDAFENSTGYSTYSNRFYAPFLMYSQLKLADAAGRVEQIWNAVDERKERLGFSHMSATQLYPFFTFQSLLPGSPEEIAEEFVQCGEALEAKGFRGYDHINRFSTLIMMREYADNQMLAFKGASLDNGTGMSQYNAPVQDFNVAWANIFENIYSPDGFSVFGWLIGGYLFGK
ncbi:MAG: hypothetical protein NDI94_06230 [Candidatus Woesearchaeota archaeon]|nr:hypothetical protein [Candidatus Woesearchaeota archaeon]